MAILERGKGNVGRLEWKGRMGLKLEFGKVRIWED